MNHRRTVFAAAAALALSIAGATAVHAQSSEERPGGLLGDLFGGGSDRSPRAGQLSDADIVVRLDRLENQIRQLTGAIEQLQFRNQQLEQALNRSGGEAPQPSGRSGMPPMQSAPQPSSAPPSVTPSGADPSGRRSDVFDPTLHPNAPGVPRPLGTILAPEPGGPSASAGVGVPGGRQAGEPLDLSTLSSARVPPGSAAIGEVPGSAPGSSTLPPPPPRNTSSTGAQAVVQPPSQQPKDLYDLAYGYLLRKDYALAEQTFRTFLKEHPSHRLVPDATYWLGESMYQRQRYRDAAESFLAVTTKHEQATKAPDALFRLGQSLAAMGEKEAACAALSEVGRKYPRASSTVKQGVGREQKRVQC